MEMDTDSNVFVEYLGDINVIVKKTFQGMQRIKLICMDASMNFLVFGATSGGIYIFRMEPCEFLKLIPCKEGSANLIGISPDERHIGIATSRGLILIIQNFIEENNAQYQVFSEHEGKIITYIKWHRNEVYIGDECGKVSVVSIISAVFQTKSIFQIPSASLMTLDSGIVQIDAYQSYLLVSTKTRTYLCNTEKEHYIQIGKKLRDGYFGACFCNTSNDVGTNNSIQNLPSAFKTINESELIITEDNTSNTKIFCARPGARLWEVGFDAKVLVTYQFKNSLKEKSPKLLLIGCEEESVLQIKADDESEHIPDNFSFNRLFPVSERFILTYDSNRVYIFDPIQSKLVFWTAFSNTIRNIAYVNNTFYVWKNNLEVDVLSVVELEHLILATLYKKQYYLCAELCVKFSLKVQSILEESKKLYLLSVLKNKIQSEELLEGLTPILDKVKEHNEKVISKQAKNSIVIVENMYVPNIKEKNSALKVIEDDNKDFKLVSKQYRLNKTHRTVDIPEVLEFLQAMSTNELFLFFKQFIIYILKELNEDSSFWCKEQYLKQISKRNMVVNDLEEESLAFLTDGLIEANNTQELSCSCGHPLPKCHKNPPNFYKTALEIFNTKETSNKLIEKIPYLWRYKIKTEIDGLNIPLLVQFSDLNLFREYRMDLKYDNWHDVLGYFNKISKGLCLNCDNKIETEGLLTWTELAKVIVESMGASNALKILEKYAKYIPKGALDPTFYQSCIFAHSFSNGSNVKPDAPLRFVEDMDGTTYHQFQVVLEKYFKRKYDANRSSSYIFPQDTSGLCFFCKLPLRNDILYEVENNGCGHKFHKICFNRNNNKCKACE